MFRTDDSELYLDGALIGTDVSGAPTNPTGLVMGANYFLSTASNSMDGLIGYQAQYDGDLTEHADFASWLAAIAFHYGVTLP